VARKKKRRGSTLVIPGKRDVTNQGLSEEGFRGKWKSKGQKKRGKELPLWIRRSRAGVRGTKPHAGGH